MALMSHLSLPGSTLKRTLPIRPADGGVQPSLAGIEPPGWVPPPPPNPGGYISPLPPPPVPGGSITPQPTPPPPVPGGPPTLLPPGVTYPPGALDSWNGRNRIYPPIGQGYLAPTNGVRSLLDTSYFPKLMEFSGGATLGGGGNTGPGPTPGPTPIGPPTHGPTGPTPGTALAQVQGTAQAQGFQPPAAAKVSGLPSAASLSDVYNLLPKRGNGPTQTHWTFGGR